MFRVQASSGIWTPGSSESSEEEDEEDDEDDEAARTDDGRLSGGGAGAARCAGGTWTSLAVPPQTAYLSPLLIQSTL